MDDLARAAGLSRQGLYLHFDTKEALFKAAVLSMASAADAVAEAALGREDLDPEERLVGAFVALHARIGGAEGSEHLGELLETATVLVGPVVAELEAKFARQVAEVMVATGMAAPWKKSGVSAKELAEHLCAASTGWKHLGATPAVYRARMRVAVRIVARGVQK